MGIPENVARGKQAKIDQQLAEAHGEQFVEAMLAGWSKVFKDLTPAARRHACKLLHDRFADKLKIPCGPGGAAADTQRREELRRQRGEAQAKLVEAAVKQALRIIELCAEVPERGEDFAASVAEGADDMMATIEERGDVTAEQQRALDNWEEGVSRWIK